MTSLDRAQRLADLSRSFDAPARPSVWFASVGDAVTELQEKLAKHGFYDPDYGDMPGQFGRMTDQALRAFQGSKALRPDGICGPVTWRALSDVWGR